MTVSRPLLRAADDVQHFSDRARPLHVLHRHRVQTLQATAGSHDIRPSSDWVYYAGIRPRAAHR